MKKIILFLVGLFIFGNSIYSQDWVMYKSVETKNNEYHVWWNLDSNFELKSELSLVFDLQKVFEKREDLTNLYLFVLDGNNEDEISFYGKYAIKAWEKGYHETAITVDNHIMYQYVCSDKMIIRFCADVIE